MREVRLVHVALVRAVHHVLAVAHNDPILYVHLATRCGRHSGHAAYDEGGPTASPVSHVGGSAWS